jgi:hypothetical protein
MGIFKFSLIWRSGALALAMTRVMGVSAFDGRPEMARQNVQ